MKIAVIHGSPHKGNCYHAVELIKEEMKKQGEVEFVEHFLPRELPEFCRGCFTCFLKGEEKCPDAAYVQPILQDMLEADGLIFTSPTYVLAESAAVKNLLDHLGYIFIVHRAKEEMFSKKALIISSTAGAGTNHSIKTIARSLKFWGVNHIYKYGFAMYALKWDEMSEKRRKKIEARLNKKSKTFYSDLAIGKKHRPYLYIRFMYMFVKKLQSSVKEETLDNLYWRQKGWFDGKSPFKQIKETTHA